MKLLLDTHAFLWSFSARKRLSLTAIDAIADMRNEVFVSAISYWEIAIKIRLGKLRPVGSHPADMVQVAENLGFNSIPMLPEEAAGYGTLSEATHNDPFDRMLAWQAISRGLVLVSRDPEMKLFKVDGLRLMW